MQAIDQTRPQLLVNATPLLSNLTGVGHVTSEISSRLAASDDFKTGFYTPFKVFDLLEELCRPTIRMHLVRKARKVFGLLPFKEQIRDLCARANPGGSGWDLYWEPNFIPLDTITARKTVTTVHDMSFHEHPEWHPKDRISFFSSNFFERIGRSDIVVTVSEFSRRQFLESQSEVGEDRVKVIPCGINHDQFRVLDPEAVEVFRREQNLPERFSLFVGSIEPRKNLVALLQAYEQLPAEQRNECPLVLVGAAGWENKEIHQHIKQLGPGVRTFGYLKNPADLALMYNAASVFVYPSLYEGFGIPPLEAMACGTPVCLSSIPVFSEVYGSDTACYADPYDPETLAASLSRLMSEGAYCDQLIEKGLSLARTYTWNSVYDQYNDLFRSLI